MAKLLLIHSSTRSWQSLVDLCLPNHQEYCNKHGYHCVNYWEDNPLIGRFIHAYEELPKYDIVAIADMDLLFMNHSVKLEDKLGHYDFVIGRDLNGINASLVIIRNTEWARNFLEYALNHQWNTVCPDQTTLAYNLCCADKTKWHVVQPQRELISYRGTGRNMPEEEYQDGDFILTTPGMEYHKRIKILKDALDSSSRNQS